MPQPFVPRDAKLRAREAIGAEGSVYFTKHALEEAGRDGLTRGDILNVLRGGSYFDAEFENGQWRYRVETNRMAAVIAFNERRKLLVVITCWRHGR